MAPKAASRADAGSAEHQGAPGRVSGAVAGLLAVGVTLGVAELVAGLLSGGRSFVVALGDVVIGLVPGWLERAVISTLGSNDKPFLILNIVVVSGLLGAALGILSVRRFLVGAGGIAVMTAVGVAASLSDPQTDVAGPLVAGVAAAAGGILALWALLRAARPSGVAMSTPALRDPPRDPAARDPAAGGLVDRKHLLGAAAAAVVVAGAGAFGGRVLAARKRVEAIRQAIRIPRPARRAPPAPAGAALDIPGLTPLYVPNNDFYRIDTALLVPQVDPASWSLEVKGRVDRPFTLSYAELMAIPHIEADVTLSCVSNEIGGGLVGNARWQGVLLADLLARAGIQRGATQVIGRSVDGFTAGFPTQVALDGRDAMVAVAMNGEPLPAAHGFPARLVVPGLYGYVSATKWLTAIELTSFDEVDGYWIPRGWDKEAPIKTQSRIEVASSQVIAGVAWAPTRGIERVEVRIDGGPWQQATLAAALGDDCWRQWFHPWERSPGRYVIAVRATDGTGETQTAERTDIAPNGASGHHTIQVDIV
ncbi:MAG: molybdopterin-dependent oxidoreductase [Gaiellaceae bacterium MAG52_C11]|nr:molybdopterin-dependent oxidoreductase [Candidatus Gaiellasilicea maunaloa]